MLEIQKATLLARQRTNLLIGVVVKVGNFSIVQIKKRKNGTCDVLKLSEPLDLNSAVSFLNSLQPLNTL